MSSRGIGAKIAVQFPDRPETSLDLEESLTIGRSPHNNLVIEDPNVSRYHAEIRRMGPERYRLIDVGSANGTWVNGKRLAAPKDLVEGDLIAVGHCRLRYSAPTDEQADDVSGIGTALLRREKTVVVLVCDIRNYTAMSEVLPAQEFSQLISQWFEQCSHIIESHGGIVDKFIGDAVMVYWIAGPTGSPVRETRAALDAARALVSTAASFSTAVSGRFPGHNFRVGVGINVGEATVGNVGTHDHPSFTVMGDSVNVAFRLEALTKETGETIIGSLDILRILPQERCFRELGPVQVKGRREPVPACALDATAGQA